MNHGDEAEGHGDDFERWMDSEKMADIGAFEAGMVAGSMLIVLILYKVSGMGLNLLQTRIKNGKTETLPDPRQNDITSNALTSRDIHETKTAVYQVKNKQNLYQQQTINCFNNMAKEQSTQTTLLTDIRDSILRQEKK